MKCTFLIILFSCAVIKAKCLKLRTHKDLITEKGSQYPVSQQVQLNFIFSDNIYILYITINVRKPKTTAKTSRHKCRSNSFWWLSLWSLCLYCYCFLASPYINQVPEKLYLGHWPYVTNICTVNAIWLLK